MQLPNRDELENSFAVRFTRVNARLRHRLEDYLGYPPDATKVPESFWQEVQDEMNRELAIVLLLIWSQSATFHGLDAQTSSSLAQSYAIGRAQTVAPAFAANTRDMLRRAATRWQASPQPVTRAELQTDLGTILGPKRAERIAKTETTKAQTDGGETGVKNTVGVRADDLWMTRDDARVCPVCEPLHGKPRTIWAAQFPQGPGDDVHPDCVLPGQLVSLPGALIGASKAFYDGPCVEIRLENGTRLAVTKNHMVLTPSGWRRAKSLRSGEYVIHSADSERMSNLVNPHADNRPAAVDEVFGALQKSRFMVTSRMPRASEQFHGDGRFVHGDIDVVTPNGLLQSDLAPAAAKLGGKESVQVTRATLVGLATQGDTFSMNAGLLPPRHRSMGGGDLIRPLLCRHGLPLQTLGIGLSARRNARLDQPASKGHAGDSRLASKFVFRFASDVAPQQIVDVRYFRWRDHVYDLQVGPYELYTCNGVVVHNCRCFIQYAVDLSLPKGGTV